MATTDNSIVIAAPLDLVWEMTNDVESWPQLFTEYAKAEVLDRVGDTVRFRLTMHPDDDGDVWSWVSERTSDRETLTVQARRLETGPFEHMNIYWDYARTPEGVRMRWQQEFHVRDGLPFGDEWMTEHLNTSTRTEMAHIKQQVEAAARRSAADSLAG